MRQELIDINPDIWDEWAQDNLSLSEMQNRYVDEHGDQALKIILKHNEQFENEQLRGVKPHHDLLSVVKGLSDECKKHIWSSNTSEVIMKVLQSFGIEEKFERIITRNDVKLLKPDAEGFGLIRDPEIALDRYLLVGDSGSDRGAARGAGIDFYHIDFFDQRI